MTSLAISHTSSVGITSSAASRYTSSIASGYKLALIFLRPSSSDEKAVKNPKSGLMGAFEDFKNRKNITIHNDVNSLFKSLDRD